MVKKYKLKKKYSISVVTILLIMIAILATLSIGYSLWSSKLRISGKVTLNSEPQPLEVTILQNDKAHYTTNTSLLTDKELWFEFISDNYEKNELVTTIRVKKDYKDENSTKSITSSFSIKNSSSEGFLYSDGKVDLIEYSDNEKVVKDPKADVLLKTIDSGNYTNFIFSATVNPSNVKNDIYYKYAINYNVDGLTRYFYYAIKILPVE